MAYTLRAPKPMALLPLLGVPVLVFAASRFDVSPVFVAAAGALIVFQAWQRSLVLKVDESGIQLGRGVEYEYGDQRTMITRVPWSSIRDVVVASPGPAVGVRLKPGAPLPAGARGVISDPANPDTVQADLQTGVPSRFDRERLAEAVAAHGGGAQLVDA